MFAIFSAFSPVTATPSRSHAAATPITRMMEAVNWLNNTLLSAEPCSSSSVPSSPTDDLSCDDNLTRLINMLPQPAASQHPQNSELSSSVSSVANSSQHIAAGADGDDISLPPTIPPDHRKVDRSYHIPAISYSLSCCERVDCFTAYSFDCGGRPIGFTSHLLPFVARPRGP